MKLLIDSDYYLFRAATACEYEIEMATDVWTYSVRVDEAKEAFAAEMERFQKTCPDHRLVVVYGGPTNFRYAIYTEYKSGRRKYRRPAGLAALREWAFKGWTSLTLPGVEGDDVLGIMAEPGDVIVSRDKDMHTIPGIHVDGDKLLEIGQWEADYNFFCQVLTGDATDGYPGCKGVGPVSARKLLADCKTPGQMWGQALRAYAKAGHSLEFALQMARCARILRPDEYDHVRNQPILWQPPIV